MNFQQETWYDANFIETCFSKFEKPNRSFENDYDDFSLGDSDDNSEMAVGEDFRQDELKQFLDNLPSDQHLPGQHQHDVSSFSFILLHCLNTN